MIETVRIRCKPYETKLEDEKKRSISKVSKQLIIYHGKGILFGIEPMSKPDNMFLRFLNLKKNRLTMPPGPRFGQYNSFLKERLAFNTERKIPILDPYVREMMKFSESTDLDGPQLSNAMSEIKEIVLHEPRVAEVALGPVVLERIVKILRETNKESIKYTATYILSVSKLDKCNAVIIKEAIQSLVDLMHDEKNCTALRAMYTLICLARGYPEHANVIAETNALNVALDVVTNFSKNVFETLNCVAHLMVVICPVKLSPDKELVALTILDKIIQFEYYYHCHIARACDALQYLCFKKHLELEEQTFKRQIALVSHTNNQVAISAIKVVGNIARWGSDDQLEILAKDSNFLEYLGKTMTCKPCKPDEFLKEVCMIISEIAAAQDGIFIEALEQAGLIDNLCSLLEVAEFDVKLEAACAIFNCIKAG